MKIAARVATNAHWPHRLKNLHHWRHPSCPPQHFIPSLRLPKFVNLAWTKVQVQEMLYLTNKIIWNKIWAKLLSNLILGKQVVNQNVEENRLHNQQ